MASRAAGTYPPVPEPLPHPIVDTHTHLDIGTGAWDRDGRPSEVKLDRVIRVRPEDVRREGAVLPKDRFDDVARGLERRG